MIINRENKKEKNKGITIVALVVTIIVLLILAGVTLATLSGENGILTKAKTAKEEYKKAQYQEAIDLAKLQAHTEQGKYKIDAQKFLERVYNILQANELFEGTNYFNGPKIKNDKQWELYLETIEGWPYWITEEQTEYIEDGEEIKKEEIVEGDITFIYDTNWTNKPKLVIIEKNNDKFIECDIQYALSSDPSRWYTKNQVNVEDNLTTINVELVKEKRVVATAQHQIEKIDRLKPEEFSINKNEAIVTTDSITIRGQTKDHEATQVDGCSEIKQYEFSSMEDLG